MSFRVDLWNGFDKIKSSFISNIKKLNLLNEILSQYSSYIKEYSINLIDLYQTTQESLLKEDSILDDSLKLLIASFKLESELYKNHFDLISSNIKDVKKKIEQIKYDISQLLNTNEQARENFNKVLNDLIFLRDKFHKSCKELSLKLIEEEVNKIFEEKSVKNNNNLMRNTLSRTKNSQEIKEKELKKVFEAKNDYVNFIPESNGEREKFNNITEKILYNLEISYKDLMCCFENLIKTYIKDKIEIHHLITEKNSLNNEKTYKNIVCETIIYNFIEKNATKEFPMIQLDFIPFKLSKNVIENQKHSKYNELKKNEQNNVFNKIKNYITINNINYYENDFSKKFLSIIQQNNELFTEVNLLDENKILFNKNDNIQSYIDESDDFEIILGKKGKAAQEKKINFNFIKEFIFALIIEKAESQKFGDIKQENLENKNIIANESCKYNHMLFKFMDLIDPKNKDNFEYLNCFIKYLSFNRSKGIFKLNYNVYQILINIFKFILMNYNNSYDYIKNIILLSQTFFRVEQDDSNYKKVYLLNGLKDLPVFKQTETWHRAINYSLSISIKNSSNYCLNIINKDLYFNNLNKIVFNIVISYLYDLKISTNDKNVYLKVRYFYTKIYNLDEKNLEENVNKILENDELNYNQTESIKENRNNINKEQDINNEDKK